MTPDPAKRPRQVTLGGGLAAVGGLLLVLGLYDSLGATQSFEVRRQLAETLATPPASGLGIDVEQALSVMRVLITAAAVASGLSIVLGIFTVLGDNRARWGLLACAVVVFLATPFAGAGLLGLGVTLGTIMVFSGPGRDWFAGRPIRDPSPAARAGRAERTEEGSKSRTGGKPGDRDAGTPGSGDRTVAPSGAASVFASRGAPGGAPEVSGRAEQTRDGHAPAGLRDTEDPFDPPQGGATVGTTGRTPHAGAAVSDRRPSQVTQACVATWIGCGVAVLISVVLLLAGALARTTLESALADEPELVSRGLSAAAVVDGMVISAVLCLVWAAAAALLALGAWRRKPATGVLLLVSAAVTVVVGIAFPLGLLNAALGAFVVVKLLRRDARDWFGR